MSQHGFNRKQRLNQERFSPNSRKKTKKAPQVYEELAVVEDSVYLTDDNNQRIAKLVFEPNGKIQLYRSQDNFATHSHDTFSSMAAYIHRTLRAYQGFRNTKGDLYHRPENQNTQAHPWRERI